MKDFYTPELLSPAGSLSKLKYAVDYGANAVYISGLKFGLRAASENFNNDQMLEGVQYAHERSVKVYVVLNGFLHDKDLEELKDYLYFLDDIKIDAVIASDLGVIKTVRENTKIPVHLSTQASCLNVESAKFWKKVGCERIVLGREVSIKEASRIRELANIEVEIFIHGSMCMAYSGNCVISNFTQGRDSNRGGCAHSCRFEYSIDFQDQREKKRAFFMSSKDLNGLRVLKEVIDAKIDSIKVEGRMKSHLYAATMSKVYSEALNYYREHGDFLSDDLSLWEEELKKVNHRSYAPVNLIDKADEGTIFNERENDSNIDYKIVGRVIAQNNDYTYIRVQNAINLNDKIEYLSPGKKIISQRIGLMLDLMDREILRTKPSMLIKVNKVGELSSNTLLRMKCL